MNRPTSAVRFAILGVGVVYSLVLYFSGFQLDGWGKRIIALLPAVGTTALALWDGWLWRLPVISRLTHRPRLDGLWRVVITPTDESHIPDDGNRGPIEAYAVITQTFWSIHVRLCAAESGSRSRAHFWDLPNGADVEHLTFIYENVPHQRYQHRSTRHIGSCVLDTVSKRPQAISGYYFTDRYTKGDLELTLIDRSHEHASYLDAKRHAEAKQGSLS